MFLLPACLHVIRIRRDQNRGLLFEEILECLAGVVGAQAGWGGGFLFAGDADFVERAVVARIFLGYALGDRLHALEAASGIEIHALLAGMEFEAALGAKAGRWDCLQHGAALGAAGNGASAGHVYGLWTHAVVASGWRQRGRLFSGVFFSGPLARFLFAVAVLISMLTVFSQRTSLTRPPSTLAYCLAAGVSRQV
jgi:hypothetical protein